MFVSYENIKKTQGVVVARSIVRQILDSNNWNVTLVANILFCSRYCIRRARDWTLEDYSRAPITKDKKHISDNLEGIILSERNSTWYWRISLSKHINTKFSIFIHPSTIRNCLRRNKIEKNDYSKRRPYSSKTLYDYDNILPFQFSQVDTKYIEDFDALWNLAFILRKFNLPLYQWTYIDVKTKFKFIAYSYSLRSDYWLSFILFIATYLRSIWIDYHMNFQVDNWVEFCKWSKRKEEDWNDILKIIDCSLTSIPAWKKYLQWIVERSHRTDDEMLYRPKLWRIDTIQSFLWHASKYIYTYNNHRPHFWRWMNSLTPIEKLTHSYILLPSKFNSFPIFLLEDLEKIGGYYLKDFYLLLS